MNLKNILLGLGIFGGGGAAGYILAKKKLQQQRFKNFTMKS